MHANVPAPKLRIANHAGPRALAPGVRAALSALGYEIVTAEQAAPGAPAKPGQPSGDRPQPPGLRIADERFVDRLPSPAREPEMPILLLCGTRPLSLDDPRIAGRVERPALLSTLYRILQQSLEPNPRTVPRTATRLTARATQKDRRWIGSILTLSESGCYLEGAESLRPGDRLNLQFALPGRTGAELVTTRAECVSPRGEGAGLAFCGVANDVQREIRNFVALQLATLQSNTLA